METRFSETKVVPYGNDQKELPSSPGIALKDVEESRAFVNKIVCAAQSVKGFCGGEDMLTLAHRIEAIQEDLEKYRADPIVSKGLFHSIIDMGQIFLDFHKKFCQ